VIIFMPTSSPRLTRFFCFYKCVFFLCYTLVLSPLLHKVGFRFNLTSFWGYLRFVSCDFDCFIGTLKPFKTRSNKLFIYPLIELLKIQWTSHHGSFSSCCHASVYIILEEVVQVNEGFSPP